MGSPFNNKQRHLLYDLRNFFSYIIPKKKNYYVFRQAHGGDLFTGNIKSLLLYIHENHKEISTAIISFNKNVIEEANKLGITTKSSYLKMTWALLRAEYIIIDSNSIDFDKGRYDFIQLWHGSGFKNVCLMNNNTKPERKEKLAENYKKYQLVIATSESDKVKQDLSFGTDKTRVTGYPRNDIFFADQTFINSLKEKYSIDGYRKIITYAPTFRDYSTFPPFSTEFWEKLQAYLEKENALFVVNKHYKDLFLEVPKNHKNILDLSLEIDDVQELLLISDVLISDYSSIATDFVLTNRPVLIFSYDLEDYRQNCRSIYYDVEEILPKPFISTEKELLQTLMEDKWYKEPEAIESYNQFRDQFHQYVDGDSSKRVMEEILKIKRR